MATRSQIIEKIVVKMDELTPFDEGLAISNGNEGSMPIRAYAESILNECTKEHLKNCPYHKIPSDCVAAYATPTSGSTVITFTKGAGYIKNHFIKLTAWKRGVVQTVLPGSSLAKLQGNTYTQGKNSKPVVVEYDDTLEAYTSDVSSTYTGTYDYVKYVVAESISDDATLDYIAWLAASKILGIMGEESSKYAYENYVKAIA